MMMQSGRYGKLYKNPGKHVHKHNFIFKGGLFWREKL